MHDILGTVCLLIILTTCAVGGIIAAYSTLGITGVIAAFILLAMTVLLYYRDKI
ncbi:hypothetical protein [Bacillus phage phiAGATE]|uniref:Uncharacterized protein n=1 Tax=Bacillus phage phiAGATE TaxID=1204533 RepID=L0LC99_9CAUD|nr:hypothetical protein G380_gp076 [Bacillus phage phiAGATE]AGB62726.1 hypothetical protein [Bacillus phage phiAGATE]